MAVVCYCREWEIVAADPGKGRMYYPELPGKKMSTRKILPGTTRNSPKPRKCTPTHWNPNNIPETVAGGSTTRKLPGFEPLEDHGLAAYLESTDRHKKKYTSSSLRYNYPENISSANNPTITTRKSLTQVSPITRNKTGGHFCYYPE